MAHITEIVSIRRSVLAELAKLTREGNLVAEIENSAFSLVSENGSRYRCCVHKERAVLKERFNLAMGQEVDMPLAEAAQRTLAGEYAQMPIISVLPEACDQCPIDKFFVTNACRNCIAHNCKNSCPKNAIMIVQNQAYIDKTKCVECGMCKKSCSYGAIIEVNRPCEGACELKAIKAGSDRKAVIDYDKCVQCGGCKVACPFGAISDRTYLVQVLRAIDAGKQVHALLAPAFIGQFGAKVQPGQVIAGLKKIGFSEVEEVSFAADIVTLEEAKEFAETVPQERPFMTTSCCPAFVGMVDKHLPQVKELVSITVSPMIAAGKVVKERNPEAVTVFVGPCVAKKYEAEVKGQGVIDYVLTFEELQGIFEGLEIDLSAMEAVPFQTTASRDGNIFARAGGVEQAFKDTAAQLAPDLEVCSQRKEGLGECRMQLLLMKAGKVPGNFFEGMACQGGCVGGPGSIADYRVTSKLVDKFGGSAQVTTAPENEAAKEAAQQQKNWHHHA